MSSSKIFKKDSHFTPISLVQRQIAATGSEAQTSAVDLNSPFSPDSPPLPETKSDHPGKTPLPPAESAQAPPIDLQAIKKEAYNQGMADLAAQYQAEFQQTVMTFAEACQKIDNQRKKLLERSRGDMINLIIALSKQILGQELAMPRNIIAATLQTAIEQSIESEEYYVTLHPDDLAFAEEKVPELIASIRGLERIVFKTDRNMTRGGCLLESTDCSVDATIETQMESMREFLEEQAASLPAPETE